MRGPQDPIGRPPGGREGKRKSKKTKKGVWANRAKKKTDGTRVRRNGHTADTCLPVMGWVTCFAFRCRTRAGQLDVLSSPDDDAVSSAASWLRSRHASIWKGEEKAMRPHTHTHTHIEEGRERGQECGCQLGYPVALQG